jgi:hypothetical protein
MTLAALAATQYHGLEVKVRILLMWQLHDLELEDPELDLHQRA